MLTKGRWNLIGFKCDRNFRDAIERAAIHGQFQSISEFIRNAVLVSLKFHGVKIETNGGAVEPTPLLDGLLADRDEGRLPQRLQEFACLKDVPEAAPVKPEKKAKARKPTTNSTIAHDLPGKNAGAEPKRKKGKGQS